MRGKNKKLSTARRAQQIAEQAERLRAELDAERELLVEVESEERVLAELVERLGQAREDRDSATSPETTALRAEADTLDQVRRDTEETSAAVRSEWDAVSSAMIRTLGGDGRAWELFGQMVSHMYGVVTDSGLRGGGLSVEQAQRLEIARGLRRPGSFRTIERPDKPPLLGVYHPTLEERVGRIAADGTPQEADDQAVALARKVDSADWDTVDGLSMFTWQPFPWVQGIEEGRADHPVAAKLGYTTLANRARDSTTPTVSAALSSTLADTPTAAMSKARRDAIAVSDPLVVIDRWAKHLRSQTTGVERVTTPLTALPQHSLPVDAVALRKWYARAAMGQWMRSLEAERSETQTPAETTANTQTTVAPVTGAVAAGLVSAAIYWLPPTQTFDLLDSEPLTDTDDLRLPYPQTLLTFAEPPAIEPTGLAGNSDDPASARAGLDEIETSLLTGRKDTPFEKLGHFIVGDSAAAGLEPTYPLVWEAIAAQGARVEGILLLADSLGQMTEEAAWCLAIPSRQPDMCLARVVIPVRWRDSMWAPQILNAAATVAWADWHSPAEQLDGTEVDPAQPNPSSDPGQEVRVLAVRRTKAQAGQSEATGRTVAAHVRRGHWRRQRHGPRAELVKRVRIAPTLVNADRRAFTSRVYRLPSST